MGTASTWSVRAVRAWLPECREFFVYVPWADESVRIGREEAERLLHAVDGDREITAHRGPDGASLYLG